MDISETLAPKSDQQNFDDYVSGPRTVTVSGAKVPGGEQPVHVELAEYPGRPFKPNKSMRRILAKGWGPDSDAWIGRRLTLFGNPDVRYGGKAVGGIEISHMSHIDKPFTTPLTETRGKKKNFTVQPLKEAAPTPAQAPNAIPDKVRADVAKVKGTDRAADYLAWLDSEGAPERIKQYAHNELENNE